MPVIIGKYAIEVTRPITKDDLGEILSNYRVEDKIQIDGRLFDIGAFVIRYVKEDDPEFVIKFIGMISKHQSYLCEQMWTITIV
jgi:hypothetical protein